MIAETLAIVSAANAAVGQIKTLIGTGSDITSMGKQLSALLTAEETLKAEGESKKKSLLSMALGRSEDSFDEFMELERIREAKKEIESAMRLFGRPGLYDDWVKWQAQERVRKKQEAEDRAKARAFIANIIQWGIALIVVYGSALGLLWWTWVNYG